MTDFAYRDHLILTHLALVETVALSIARKFPSWFDTESFVSAGTLGLIEAATSYRSETNVPFSPFARLRIHGAIIDYLRSLSPGTRELRRWQKEKRQCEDFFLLCWQRPALAEQIVRMMGMSWDDYCAAYQRVKATESVSFEEMCVDGEISLPHQMFCDPSIDVQEHGLLARATSHLDDRQRLILTLYYCYELAETAIGQILGISQVYVNKIRKNSERLIREYYTTDHAPLTATDYALAVFDTHPRQEYRFAMGYMPRQHDGR